MVLLHGVGLDHTVWDDVRDLLSPDVEVHAPDLLGHGVRAHAGDDVTLADLAADVADDLPLYSHIVGFSLGALVAQYLAVHRPELVATLTSVSSVCRRTPDERAAVLGRLEAAENDFAASASASLDRWYAGTSVPAEQVVRTRQVLLANDPRSFVNCYRVFATADADVADDLHRITVPALAITGEGDPGSTPDMTRRLAAAMPNCTAVVVPGARHMLPVEQPAELVRQLSSLIGRSVHA
jgi:(E)-2-((N-methylformamido)methylene)succinate hydrolase